MFEYTKDFILLTQKDVLETIHHGTQRGVRGETKSHEEAIPIIQAGCDGGLDL